MATGPGGSDAENGVKMACRDRFHGTAQGGDDAASAGEGTGAGPGAPQPQEPGDQEREDGLQMYGDSAYGSGEARAAYQAAGHDTIIKPGPLRPAVAGGFTIDDFTVDEQQGTVTCPAGQVRHMIKSRNVTARRPRAGPHAGIQAGLPDPVDDRTGHRLDRHPERPPRPAPLHRHRGERRLAARPVRRHQLRTLVNAGLTRDGRAWILA